MTKSPTVSFSSSRRHGPSHVVCRSPKTALAAAAAMLMTLSAAHAVTYNWSGGSSGGDWNTGANWGGAAPNAADADVTIGTLLSGNAVNISSSVTINKLILNGANPMSLTADAGQTLTFGGPTAGTVFNAQGADYTIDANIIWAVAGGWSNFSVSTGKTLTINGSITNLGATYRQFVVTGGGKVVLNNSSNNIQQLLIQSGEAVVSSIGAIGGGWATKIGQGSDKATLTYTGAAASFANRVILASQSGSVINSNGAGTLTFTNSIFNEQATVNSVGTTLALGGLTSGVINGTIRDNTGTALKVNLVKQDSNAWTLAGANSYTGTTTVNGGQLNVNGSLNAASTVTVNAGGTLGGTGTVNGSVTAAGGTVNGGLTLGSLAIQNAGNLASAASPAVTTVMGALDVADGGAITLEINGLTGAGLTGGFDQVVVNSLGSVTLADESILQLSIGTLENFSFLTLIDNQGSAGISGTFGHVFVGGSEVTLGASNTFGYQGLTYALSYTGADGLGNDLTLSVVPEPQTWVMLMGGVGLLLGSQRLRRRSK